MESGSGSSATAMAPREEGISAQASEREVKPPVSSQVRGEVMAFAVQSAVCNLGANIFEPYINYRVQKHFAKPGTDSQTPTHGNFAQNLGGELVGDLSGAATLMVAELLFPKELHSASQAFRKCVDPAYDVAARRVLAKQAKEPDYEKKVLEWKTFQERNLVRSLIVATGGIAGNLATQKLLLGNPSPTGLIFSGKMLSTSLTTALGLCVRLAFPEQMNALDEKISRKFFVPFLSKKTDPSAPAGKDGDRSHADRIRLGDTRDPAGVTRSPA